MMRAGPAPGLEGRLSPDHMGRDVWRGETEAWFAASGCGAAPTITRIRRIAFGGVANGSKFR